MATKRPSLDYYLAQLTNSVTLVGKVIDRPNRKKMPAGDEVLTFTVSNKAMTYHGVKYLSRTIDHIVLLRGPAVDDFMQVYRPEMHLEVTGWLSNLNGLTGKKVMVITESFKVRDDLKVPSVFKRTADHSMDQHDNLEETPEPDSGTSVEEP